jgi:hypothetical protein
MIYAGHQYMLFFFYHSPLGIHVRCSGIKTIDDDTHRFIPLMVYILLNCKLDKDEIVQRLGISIPVADSAGHTLPDIKQPIFTASQLSEVSYFTFYTRQNVLIML